MRWLSRPGVMLLAFLPAAASASPHLATALEGACPGTPGRVRVRFGIGESLADARVADWKSAARETDFACQFKLDGLKSGTRHHFVVETASLEGQPGDTLRGQFVTAPSPSAPATVKFCVVTGQMYRDLDDPRGYHIYPAMQELQPDFIVFTGDNVYYDNEPPKAVTTALARYHWERMHSLPCHVELLRNISVYWEKDDHDTLQDDCWPGQTMGELTFAEGQRLSLQQVPASEKPCRTFRWGKDLQVWLTEGRDFRSPNNLKDGPDKTIWGAEQKAWLQRRLLGSDATFKVLVSPTPLVGPDRDAKADNHANSGFRHEGREMRAWFRQNLGPNFFVGCGDRHWQCVSLDARTGSWEYSYGPASDAHAGGWREDDRRPEHRFLRVKGGFLSVETQRQEGKPVLTFRFHDVKGEVVYEDALRAS